MVAQNLGMKNDLMLSSAHFKKQRTIVNVMFWEEKFGKINGLYGDVAYKSTPFVVDPH